MALGDKYPHKRKDGRPRHARPLQCHSGRCSLDEVVVVVLAAAVINEVTVLPETQENQSHFSGAHYTLAYVYRQPYTGPLDFFFFFFTCCDTGN